MSGMDSVKTALKVFEAVAMNPRIGVSELAQRLEEPKSTVQRCLVTLHEAGWIRPADGPRRSWVATTRLFTLGRAAESEPRLRSSALPVMQRLRDETGETIHLMVPDGHEVVLIERIDSTQPVRTVRMLGARAPLHVASNGKAVLAYLTAEEQDRYLKGPLERWTTRSLTRPLQIRTQLRRIRETGYAVNIGELDEGVNAVAAPVFNRDMRPIAAVSISCPAIRLPKQRVADYGARVAAAAAQITRALTE